MHPLCLIIFLFFMPIFANEEVYNVDVNIEGATWWNSTWDYRKQLNITNPNALLNDFSVMIEFNGTELYEAGKLNENCSDIRFTNSTDDVLQYRNISCITNDNSTLSSFYVEIPHFVNGTNTLYMYYGNSEAEYTGNNSLTVIFHTKLLSYWKLDENTGTVISDSFGSNNLTANSDTGWVSSAKINSGFKPSSSNGLSRSNALSGDFDLERTDALTVSYWVDYVSASGYHFIIGKMIDYWRYTGWQIMTVDNTIGFQEAYQNIVNSLYTHTNDQFIGLYYVTITYDGSSDKSGVIIYVNGSPVNTTNEQNSLVSSIKNSADFGIGRRAGTGVQVLSSNWIDEIGIWNRALSGEEVTTLYNSGDGLQYFEAAYSFGAEENNLPDIPIINTNKREIIFPSRLIIYTKVNQLTT